MKSEDTFAQTQRKSYTSPRRLIFTVIAVALVALMGACAPQVVEVERVVEKVVEVPATGPPVLDYEGELVVMFDGGYMPPEGLTDAQKAAGETGNEYMAELIAQWEDMHLGIDVVPFGVPEAPPGAQTALIWYMKTAIAAGQGPDLMRYYGGTGYDGAEGDRGLLVPLDAYFRQPNPYVEEGRAGSDRWVDQWENGFDGILAQSKSLAGRYYSIPLETAAPSLIYYNKTALDELGLEFPSPRTNITVLVELLKELKAAGHETPMHLMCCSPAGNWDSLIFDHSIIEPKGLAEWRLDYKVSLSENVIEAEEFSRAIKQGLFAATDTEYKETLRLGKLWVPYVTEEWKIGAPVQLSDFLTGKVLIRMSGSWEAEAILGNPEVDFEVGVASGPVVGVIDSEYSMEEEPGPFVGGPAGAWVVNAAAVKRGTLEASIDFLQFLSANWGHAVKGRPGLVPVIKDVEPNVRPEVAEPAKAHIPTSVMRWSYADMVDAGAREEAFIILQEFYLDQITIDEAAERMQQVWEEWADRAIETNSTENGGSWDLSKW